jgi:hypothetical protein
MNPSRQHDLDPTIASRACPNRCFGSDLSGDEGYWLTSRRPITTELPAPSEQHVGVYVVTTRDQRYRDTRLETLLYDPLLLLKRPTSPMTAR